MLVLPSRKEKVLGNTNESTWLPFKDCRTEWCAYVLSEDDGVHSLGPPREYTDISSIYSVHMRTIVMLG